EWLLQLYSQIDERREDIRVGFFQAGIRCAFLAALEGLFDKSSRRRSLLRAADESEVVGGSRHFFQSVPSESFGAAVQEFDVDLLAALTPQAAPLACAGARPR